MRKTGNEDVILININNNSLFYLLVLVKRFKSLKLIIIFLEIIKVGNCTSIHMLQMIKTFFVIIMMRSNAIFFFHLLN